MSLISDEPLQFKGWTIPGPRVPGGVEPEANESLDALSGHFKIFQYREGHRFSTDDLLVAWYGSTNAPAAARVLDLGSGIGSVGMTAAWRMPGAQFVTVEAQAISVRLAKKSARYNGLESRYEIREGDFRKSEVLRADEKFELVLGSPPYFPLGSGILSEHEQKVACRFEVRGTIVDYCAVASRHLAPGGMFACVFPRDQEARILEGALSAGLMILKARDIIFREGEPPLLGIYAMMRLTDLPGRYRGALYREASLVIRTQAGAIHAEYSTVKLSIGFPP